MGSGVASSKLRSRRFSLHLCKDEFQELVNKNLVPSQQLHQKNDMCTVLRQYLNQNPENPLNEMRKSPPITSPVLVHFYIPPSKMEGALNNKDTLKQKGIIMRVCQSKSTWELNQDLVPGSEQPVLQSRFPNGQSSQDEDDEFDSQTEEKCRNELKDGRISRLGHYADTSFILKSLN